MTIRDHRAASSRVRASVAASFASRAAPAAGRAALRLLALAGAVVIVVGLAVAAFAWPSARLAPRGLPVGITGSTPAVTQVRAAVQRAEPGALNVTRYPSPAALRQAIRDRQVYGGLDLQPPATIYTASAASPVVAQLLAGLGVQLGGPAGTAPRVLDVVPAPATDPRGAAFASAMLPLVLAGEISAVLVIAMVPAGPRRAGVLLATSAVAGATTLAVARGWLEVLPAHAWATGGALSLLVLAIAATAAGFHALLGTPGLGVAAVLMIFIGNPTSGATSAPRLLPAPADTVGQLLPPGAGATLVRNVTFFDGADAGGELVVLITWAVLGLIATSTAHRILHRTPATPARGQHLKTAHAR